MAVVSVHLGQAGNQAGYAFLNEVWKHTEPSIGDDATRYRHFRETASTNFFARTVNVDTEPKVISSILEKQISPNSWRYPTGRQLLLQRGAGNNWASGYHEYGQVYTEDIMNMIRLEVEACDHVEGFSVIKSVAGGTGSGLGAAVLDAMQEEFTHLPIWAKVIWPHTTGETVVQHYNSVLSMAHVYQACDGVLLFENDHLQEICHRMLRIKQVTVQNLNKVLAQQLLVSLACTHQEGRGTTSTLSSLLQHMCPHPDHKLLRMRLIPQMPREHQAFTRYEWEPLTRTALAMARVGTHLEDGARARQITSSQTNQHNTIIAQTLFFMGKTSVIPTFHSARREDNRCIHVDGHHKAVGLLANESALALPLDRVLDRAWHMFRNKAFLHQYSAFGVTEADFEQHFIPLEQIVRSYRSIN
eukprot:gene11189-3246_t